MEQLAMPALATTRSASTSLTDAYEKQRAYPRVPVKTDGTIIRPAASSLSVRIHDLSPDGIQVRCSRETAVALRPSGRQPGKDELPMVTMTIVLPYRSGEVPVAFEAVMRYLCVADRDEVIFGFSFARVAPAARALIERYIDAEICGDDMPPSLSALAAQAGPSRRQGALQ